MIYWLLNGSIKEAYWFKWKSPWSRTSAMLLNGSNDKQSCYKLINVVRLVFLIPLSFTFNIGQRRIPSTFPTSNPDISLSLSLFISTLCVPVKCFLICICLALCLRTVEAIGLDENAVHTLSVLISSDNISGLPHGPLSFCYYDSATLSSIVWYMWTFYLAPNQTVNCRMLKS